MKCLVTGGAGFIGSHTVDALLEQGCGVRIVDCLAKPVHLKGRPGYIPPQAEFVEGDVRDKDLMRRALSGIDAVYHFAAYQDYLPDFSTYMDINATSTALLYELIVGGDLPVRKVIVAASQAVDGEGLYCDSRGERFTPDMRPEEQLRKGQWDIRDRYGRPARWLPTPESVANPQNPYGISKLSQERIALHLGRRYEIPTTVMRYSIVQGPRQSFYNAYSGACRIFCLHAYFDRPAVVYEDGLQVRDFVNIHDVVDANLLVLNEPRADYRTFHVGGGRPCSVLEFAGVVNDIYGKNLQPRVPGLYRYGDTRHIVSDISALGSLGWSPRRTVEDSVAEYAEYLRSQGDIEDIMAYAEEKMKNLNVLRSTMPGEAMR